MTVKQLADELKTSKTTIKNIMNRLNIKPQKKLDKGQEVIFLTEKEVEIIKEQFLEKHPAENTENFTAKESGKGEKVSENTENFTEKHTENTEKTTENTENTNISEKLIALLQQDLDAKNKQIDDLNNRLAEAMKALDQEQQLKALAEKRILELEDKAAAAAEEVEAKVEEVIKEEQEEEKRGFFSFFRRKNKR